MPDDEFDDMIYLQRLGNGRLQGVGRKPAGQPVPPGFLLVTEIFYEMFLEDDD